MDSDVHYSKLLQDEDPKLWKLNWLLPIFDSSIRHLNRKTKLYFGGSRSLLLLVTTLSVSDTCWTGKSIYNIVYNDTHKILQIYLIHFQFYDEIIQKFVYPDNATPSLHQILAGLPSKSGMHGF